MLLLGKTGMIGSRIYELLCNKYEINAPTREQLNLTEEKDIKFYLENHEIDLVVYAAGVASPDEAERDQDYAFILNSSAPKWIAKRLNKLMVPLIYLSTDAVFGDDNKNSHSEKSKTNPINYYGKTKVIGEEAVLSASSVNSVVRLISVYTAKDTRKKDFVRKTLGKLKNGEEVVGISDQYFNPTFVDNAVEAIDAIVVKRYSGIFHVGSTDCISNLDFIKLICKTFKLNIRQVKSVRFKEFFGKALSKRGKFTCLDVTYSSKKLGGSAFKSNLENLSAFKRKCKI